MNWFIGKKIKFSKELTSSSSTWVEHGHKYDTEGIIVYIIKEQSVLYFFIFEIKNNLCNPGLFRREYNRVLFMDKIEINQIKEKPAPPPTRNELLDLTGSE